MMPTAEPETISGASPAPVDSGQASIAPIGIEEGQPQTPTEGSEGEWKWAEGIDPEAVIGTRPDGSPIKAGDAKSYHHLQPTFSKATAELAELKKHEALDYWGKIDSPDDEAALAALLDIAQRRGLNLNGQAERPRGTNGQFAKADTGEGLVDLEGLIPGSDEYEQAERYNRAISEARTANTKLSALEQKFDKFVGGLSDAVAMQEARTQAESIAGEWIKGGFEKVDLDGAMALVGKPMTAEDAMFLAHKKAMMLHNYNAGRGGAPLGERSVSRETPFQVQGSRKPDPNRGYSERLGDLHDAGAWGG